MNDKHLHIVSFDIPLPANYGGVIDVYYKIKALHEAGIKVHLHCFEYGRKLPRELTEVCYTLKAYPRKVSKHLLIGAVPYIVKSRESEVLVKNLGKDKHPILFEGLHSCFHLNDFRLAHKKKFVRTHNIEHDYYQGLAQSEKNIFKRFYFLNEASKLRQYEQNLKGATGIFAISPKDTEYFSKLYGKTHQLAPFHPHTRVSGKTGKGNYALYHGNLSVGENNQAALFLVNQVFNDLSYPLMIVGNHPSKELKAAIQKFSHITLIEETDPAKIDEMIREAHINVLPTFQSTGIKLKLLNALFSGRFILANAPMAKDTGLESLCHMADTAFDMKSEVRYLFTQDFPASETEKRQVLLEQHFNNTREAEKLIRIIFP